jgi:hypothetical protein
VDNIQLLKSKLVKNRNDDELGEGEAVRILVSLFPGCISPQLCIPFLAY